MPHRGISARSQTPLDSANSVMFPSFHPPSFHLLHHVRQNPNSRDCAIAAVAMIANVTYDEVLAIVPSCVPKRGLKLWRLPRILKHLTHVKWRYDDGWFRSLNTIFRGNNSHTIKEPALAIIRPPWRLRPRHAIVLFGGWVHDGSFPRGIRWDEYYRRRWTVVRIYRARKPELLNSARLQNWVERNIKLNFSDVVEHNL